MKEENEMEDEDQVAFSKYNKNVTGISWHTWNAYETRDNGRTGVVRTCSDTPATTEGCTFLARCSH